MKNANVKGYGEVVICAVEQMQVSKINNPYDAWRIAEIKLKKAHKGCPQSIFVLLCSWGLVKGIPKGNSGDNIRENKEKLLKILDKLDFELTDFSNFSAVWRNLGFNDTHASQIDVLYALYKQDLLDLDGIQKLKSAPLY
jgi:hypothetical protein